MRVDQFNLLSVHVHVCSNSRGRSIYKITHFHAVSFFKIIDAEAYLFLKSSYPHCAA